MNTSYNCLDRHIDEGFGNEIAVIYDSPVSGQIKKFTYLGLRDSVAKFASVLAQQCGVTKGDRVLIYMPMLPETLVGMLACARIGAIHCVIFGGFSADQLATRINSAKPKVILTASYGIEGGKMINYKASVDRALRILNSPDYVNKCILFNRPQFAPMQSYDSLTIDWAEAVDATTQPHDAIPLDANDPLYILYTSGTTGDPKGIVRNNGGHAVALKYAIQSAYGMRPGDRWWTSSELGWVVGHSFICYAPMLNRNTTVMYEGKPIYTPDAGQLFRVISQHRIAGLLTSPSALRSIRGVDPNLVQARPHLSQLGTFRHLFVAGEHCDVDTLDWLAAHLPRYVSISDSWWQTETGWPITASCCGLDASDRLLSSSGLVCSPGSAGLPVPGFQVTTAVNDQAPNNQEEEQQILIKLPLPPGTAASLWANHDKFVRHYFQSYPGYYDTMDVGRIDERGFVHVMARSDDVINVSGHRLSTAALEEACYTEKSIQECAVIPIPHDVKGSIPFGVFVASKSSPALAESELIDRARTAVRKIVGPVAGFGAGCLVAELPKTKSGKTCRKTLADMAAGRSTKIPSTIENANVFKDIFQAFKRAGLNPSMPT